MPGIRELNATGNLENMAKARAARKAAAAARRESGLRSDFLDEPYWLELAKERGVRLPPPGQAPTPTAMERFLHAIGVSGSRYFRWSGEKALTDFATANPLWPARAWAGLCLEALAGGRL